MCKTNVFQHILNETANKTEIPPPVILSSDKRAETVDARYIVIELCFRSGMYPCAIADKTGLSVRAVNHILSTFDTRISQGIAVASVATDNFFSIHNFVFLITANINRITKLRTKLLAKEKLLPACFRVIAKLFP